MTHRLSQNQKVSLNSFLTTLVLLLAIFAAIRPSLVMSSDLKPLQDQQALNTTSINNVERLLTNQEIRTISKEIAALQFRRDNRTADNAWTVRDAEDLADLQNDLRELEARLLILTASNGT